MKDFFNGRMIFVITVTVLSLIFVLPTGKYFLFVSGLPDKPTTEQTTKQRDMLASSDMIKLGLDLQGGVEFLIALDMDRMVQNDLDRLADALTSKFRQEEVDAAVRVDGARRVIIVSDVKADDAKIAQDIIKNYESTLDVSNMTVIEKGTPVELAYLDSSRDRARGDSMDAALKVLKDRVNQFGLTQPIVVKQPPDRILVQVPGEADPAHIRNGLLRTASLEFHLLHPDHDKEARKFIDPATWDPRRGWGQVKPEFLMEVPGDIAGTTKTVVNKDKVAALLPANYELFLGKEVEIDRVGNRKETSNLAYVLKSRAELTGASLRNAQAITDLNDVQAPNKVSLEFDKTGTEKFAEITTDHVGDRFAVVLDGTVYSAPVIREAILFGRCEISGGFKTYQDAHELALVLKAGSLPAPLKVINEQAIGASLGSDSIVHSVHALFIGGIALVILMVFVYRTAGAIAILAMALNVLLVLAVLSMANATLTLSGVGGILLTMGMAVDANVLIYERLREELDAGKPFRAAMNAAFSRAFTVILDSHITALLPALVLLAFEVAADSIRGFWMTMAIGLIANLYTGMTVTRALVEAWVAKNKTISVGTFRPLRNAHFDFMKYRRIGFVFSGILTVVSLGFMIFHGINLGVDFTGGVVATVQTTSLETVTRPAILETLQGTEAEGKFEEVKVVKVLNKDIYQVTVPKRHESVSLDEVRNKIQKDLSAAFGDKAQIVSMQSIESLVGREFTWSAMLMMFIACLIILGYLAIRFQPVYGLAAILALAHDIIVALGVFLMLGHSLTLDIVSALMIILGYSVNESIIVFDRQRELEGEMYGKTIGEIINAAVNKTLSRTMITGGTVLISIISMLLFGGVGLKDFALILLIGIGFGMYSCVFVSSGLVHTFISARERRLGIEKAHQQKTKTVKIGA